jgi:hypothetical protein
MSINFHGDNKMESAATTTISKMLEALPEQFQDRVLEHMREYIEEIREEAKWADSFSKSQSKLASIAWQVKKEIKEGKAVPLDVEQL